MDNSIVINEMIFWNSELSKTSGNDVKLYELAFFKIFVKFELFLTRIFIHYSVGNKSSIGYEPLRKLAFDNEKQLEGVLKNSKSSYIDYSEKVQSLSKYIFMDDNDPFSLIFTDANLSGYYDKMKYIRNYIAHESDESRQKYFKNVIGETNEFTEPHIFLTKINKKNSKSYYSIYIEKIKEMSEVLINPSPYLKGCENHSVAALAAVTLDE